MRETGQNVCAVTFNISSPSKRSAIAMNAIACTDVSHGRRPLMKRNASVTATEKAATSKNVTLTTDCIKESNLKYSTNTYGAGPV